MSQPGQVEHREPASVEATGADGACAVGARYWAWSATLAAAAAAFVLWKVWVCDDAFITFRHVSNLLAGHGPVFNPGERVQAFTHPLWFALLSAGALIFDVYAVAVGLGVLLTAGLFALLAWLLRDQRHGLVVLQIAFLVLLSSKTFVEFQTSGLENSLTNLLVVALWGLLLHAWLTGKRIPVVRAAFLCGLLVLNRPDHVVIAGSIALAVLVEAARRRQWRVWFGLLGAALPVIAWYGFATVYYGTPLPNTVYAKVVMPWAQAFAMGSRYLVDYAAYEPVHAAVIGAAVVGGLCAFLAGLRKRESQAWVPGLLAVSIVLHLVYVASVGGDYMRGRFADVALVTSTVLGLALLGKWLDSKSLRASEQRRLTTFVGLVGMALFLIQMQSPRVLGTMGRGLEWIQYSLAGRWAIVVLVVYLGLVFWLLRRVRRVGHTRAELFFAAGTLASTTLLIGLMGYRPPSLAAAGWLALAGVCIAYALSAGLAGRGLELGTNARLCIVVAAAASLCDIDRRSESGSGALSDEFSCYHVRGWHNPFRHPVESLKGTTARWRKIGLTARQYAETFGPITVAYDSLGVISYYSGPKVRVIDLCGLAEPYLNRSAIPPVRRCGHVAFDLPGGYLETRGTINLLPNWFARLERMDPRLVSDAAQLSVLDKWEHPEDRDRWEATRLVIAGDLFSRARWAAIPAYIRPDRKYLSSEAECLVKMAAIAPPMQ